MLSETLILTKREKERIRIRKRKITRKILGPLRKDENELRQRYNQRATRTCIEIYG